MKELTTQQQGRHTINKWLPNYLLRVAVDAMKYNGQGGGTFQAMKTAFAKALRYEVAQ